jgi:FMN reductase
VALEGAANAGARTQLLDLRELHLPMFNPEAEPTRAVDELIETCHAADGMLWSSPLYQGSISGALKNALDWLRLLQDREPPFLHDKVVGLISAAGGTHGLQAINTMEFVTRALRAWAVPYVVPVASAARVFNEAGQIQDRSVESQLRMLGAEVVRVAGRFAVDDSLHRATECQQRNGSPRSRSPTHSRGRARSPSSVSGRTASTLFHRARSRDSTGTARLRMSRVSSHVPLEDSCGLPHFKYR